jgi:hypothetical protein
MFVMKIIEDSGNIRFPKLFKLGSGQGKVMHV